MRPAPSPARLALLALLLPASAWAQARPLALAVTRGSPEMRGVDAQIDEALRSRDLRVREVARDPLMPDRQHQRLEQFHRGVRIVGGDVTRQLAPDGTVSVFGLFHQGLDLDTAPRLPASEARAAIGRAVDGEPDGDVELVVLPLPDGYHLAYYGLAYDGVQLMHVFVDANTGAPLRHYSDYITEVGKGTGTYGDDKKISVKNQSGTFLADDGLRPGPITTYDMKGSFTRAQAVIGGAPVTTTDIASDPDNTWTDSTVVDAHVYSGWYYDYLFKRFSRRGIDDRDLRIAVITHPVNLSEINSQPSNVVGLYYINAFFSSTGGPNRLGSITLGEGAPRGFVGPGIEVKPFAAALDVVAHELTHAVVAQTARLNGFQFSEAGALNEAFADVFGIATSFFYFPPGNGALNANYQQGNALSSPLGVLGRNLQNPIASGDPDHYTQRFIGGDPHFNGVILGHAYYLAIEGGTNRTSGRSVQGVGQANREQIEKSFFRALTVLMPSNSTFALTRAATIQAARDLYGAGSSAERAITQAWDAVGVQDRTVPTAALLPNPNQGQNALCSANTAPFPNWLVGLTASAGSTNLRITQWTLAIYDAAGAPLLTTPNPGASFAASFASCGPGSDRIVANADACASFCIGLAGRTSGSAEFSFTSIDDAGRTQTATSGRVQLLAPR